MTGTGVMQAPMIGPDGERKRQHEQMMAKHEQMMAKHDQMMAKHEQKMAEFKKIDEQVKFLQGVVMDYP